MKTHWTWIIIAGVVLAILLRVGFSIPIFTTIVVISIIYVMHFLMTNMKTGVDTAWKWTKSGLNMGMGLVIFLALRFLAAEVSGIYPVDTWDKIGDSGSFFWIFWGRDVSSVILWEVMFAFVAGGLSVAWAQNKQRSTVGTIFGFSLLVLSIQLALPEYAAAYPDKHQVSTTLVDDGIVGAGWKGTKAFLFGKSNPAPTTTQGANNQPPQQELVEESKTFDIAADKSVRLCLAGHWVATTPSGNIDITTPNGIKFVGGKSGENYPPGWYTFESDGSNPAPSVAITAIWYPPERIRGCN